MRSEARSVEDLFEKSEDKREGLLVIDEVIRDAAPQLERWLLKSETYTMIGYGRLKFSDQYPILRIAPQKNYISLYVIGEKEEDLLTNKYKAKLGKVSVGKSCIMIQNIHNIDLCKLKNLILDCVKWHDSEEIIITKLC